MIDDRFVTPSCQLDRLAVWSRESNEFGWKSYLGDLYGTDDVPYTAAPRARDRPEWSPARDRLRRWCRRVPRRGHRLRAPARAGRCRPPSCTCTPARRTARRSWPTRRRRSSGRATSRTGSAGVSQLVVVADLADQSVDELHHLRADGLDRRARRASPGTPTPPPRTPRDRWRARARTARRASSRTPAGSEPRAASSPTTRAPSGLTKVTSSRKHASTPSTSWALNASK